MDTNKIIAASMLLRLEALEHDIEVAIRSDYIDILVNTDGHFAYRPSEKAYARMQIEKLKMDPSEKDGKEFPELARKQGVPGSIILGYLLSLYRKEM